MQDKKEFIVALSVFLFILTLIDIGVMKHLIYHYEMNGDAFYQVGMMEYTSPQDHRELFLPIYQKVIK